MDENLKEKLAKHGNTPKKRGRMDEKPKEQFAKHGKAPKSRGLDG